MRTQEIPNMQDITTMDLNGKDLAIHSLPATTGVKQKPSEIVLKSLPYKTRHTLNFRRNILYGKGFEQPEYNLYEISAAEDADGIIRRTIQKKRALMAKAGWSLTGLNNRTVEYLKMRFMQIGLAQGQSMNLLIKETGGDLVRFHNAFWVKRRNKDNSGGRPRLVKTGAGTKTLQPVAAYFRIAPETMRIKTDKYGNPKKYMQMMPDGRYEEYNVDDIIHFYFNRRAGISISCPGLMPAIDDVRALRRIEEQVEVLIDQHLFPLFTLTIGTDELPVQTYADGTTEVDVWTNKIEEMPSSGGLVTSHRHKFDVLQSKEVLSVEKYLEHFKKRAFTSAGMSNLDMGEGDGMNRSTADNASQILIEDVKDYQDEFKEFLEFEVINELLLERFDINVLTEANKVTFSWEEIDLESMMKMENHNSVMHTMNQITEDEMRQRNNNKIIDDDETRSKLYMHTHDKVKIDWDTEAAKEIAAAKPVATGSTSSGSGSGSSKSSNTAKNKNQPTNQHGKKSGPEKRKSSTTLKAIQLSHILGDFNKSNRDYTKVKATQWCFSLDFPKSAKDFSSRILKYIDNSVDNTYDKIASGTPSHLAKDTFVENLISLLDTLE